MRVLITGAAGFLGRHYAQFHLSRGDQVVGVDDLSNPHSFWPKGLLNRVEQDAARFFGWSDLFDLAYHFAAPVGGRTKIEGDPLFNADSLRLDSLFFRWAVQNVKTAVYPSSSAVYGVRHQRTPGAFLDEELFDPRTDQWDAPDEMYGFAKMAGEVLAYKAAAYGLNTLCIRPFSGYGEDQSFEYPVPSICARAKAHEDPIVIWGSGLQRRDFIHVDDLVRGTWARLGAGIRGYHRLNLGSGVGTTFYTVAQLAAHAAGYEPTIENDDSKPQGVGYRVADTTQMSRFYTPTISLEEGLRRVVEALP